MQIWLGSIYPFVSGIIITLSVPWIFPIWGYLEKTWIKHFCTISYLRNIFSKLEPLCLADQPWVANVIPKRLKTFSHLQTCRTSIGGQVVSWASGCLNADQISTDWKLGSCTLLQHGHCDFCQYASQQLCSSSRLTIEVTVGVRTAYSMFCCEILESSCVTLW